MLHILSFLLHLYGDDAIAVALLVSRAPVAKYLLESARCSQCPHGGSRPSSRCCDFSPTAVGTEALKGHVTRPGSLHLAKADAGIRAQHRLFAKLTFLLL